MKNTQFLHLFLFVIIFSSCQTKDNTTEVNLATKVDSVSYSIGMDIGGSFTEQGLDSTLSKEFLLQGIRDALLRKDLLISTDEGFDIVEDYSKEMELRKYTDLIQDAEKFLADNSKKENVITLKSGLQYEILKKGKGKIPTKEDMVKVHYHGTLLDGKVFDSSVEKKEPIVFSVGLTTKGISEALQLMKVGSKWKLYIPYNLAYGTTGAGKIPPYSLIMFELELISIEK